MTKLTSNDKNTIGNLSEQGYGTEVLKEMYDVSSRTVQRVVQEYQASKVDDAEGPLDTHTAMLAKSLQRSRDLNRIKAKEVREGARVLNAVGELDKELIALLQRKGLSLKTRGHAPSGETGGSAVGIIQISDVHFNEEIHLPTNTYNFKVAAQRLQKHVTQSMKHFKANKVSEVVIAMTGDMMNSDRRLDELLENATNRSKAVFLAVDILQQLIVDVNRKYPVTVTSICGNEGRVSPDLGWVDQVASDNYDFTIHQTLSHLFRGKKGITFVPIENPLEQVLEINGKHILLCHGHNGVATNSNIENGVSKYISRYSVAGIHLDYVLMGHIHSANIGDFYARSSGLTGGNAYSDKALNLYSRASQNAFVVTPEGIEGLKVDLQDSSAYEGYEFDSSLESYNSKSDEKARGAPETVHRIVV